MKKKIIPVFLVLFLVIGCFLMLSSEDFDCKFFDCKGKEKCGGNGGVWENCSKITCGDLTEIECEEIDI